MSRAGLLDGWRRRLKPFRHPWRWLLAWWLLIVAVVVASLLPARELPDLPSGGDRLEHLAAYAVLMAAAVQLYARRLSQVGAALGLILLGVLLEYLQARMALGREYDGADMLANALGVLLGAASALTPARDALLRWERERPG